MIKANMQSSKLLTCMFGYESIDAWYFPNNEIEYANNKPNVCYDKVDSKTRRDCTHIQEIANIANILG